MNSASTTINIPLNQTLSEETATSLVRNIQSILGVHETLAQLESNSLVVTYDSRFMSLSNLRIGIERSGYTIKHASLTLNISGMTCGACVNHVESAIHSLPNTLQANVNLATERANIQYLETNNEDGSNFITAITQAGYRATVPGALSEEIERLNKSEEIHQIRNKLSVSVLGSMFIFLTTMHFLPWNTYTSTIPFLGIYCLAVATLIQFWCGYSFYASGIRGLISLAPNMNSLIMIGTSVAYSYSVFLTVINSQLFYSPFTEMFPSHLFFDTSTMIITLILVGRYLETIAKVKTSQSIRQLIQLRPSTATILRDDQQTQIQIDQIQINDVVLIRPGEIIPVDGTILSGSTSIDESMLTGESIQKDKKPGDLVYTGTINFDGSITVIATKESADSLLSKIISLVEQAQGSKAPVQILADKISSIFVPIILLIGFCAFIGWGVFGPEPQWVFASTSFISIIIIACPCALGLATPTAIVTSTGKAAQLGILIKDADTLEQLKHINTIIFDKTGTLTEGQLVVHEIQSMSLSETDLLKFVASVENYSEHPIGQAIVQESKLRKITLEETTEFTNQPGLGITANINQIPIAVGNERLMNSLDITVPNPRTLYTTVYVAINNQFAGYIAVNDQLKPSAERTIRMLQDSGKEVILASGDNEQVVQNIATTLGCNLYYSQTTPQEKFALVSQLQASGKKVLMIGDGINDAPALSQSDISIAMGKGSGISIEASTITLLGNDLGAILSSIKLSKVTSKIIRQNLFWAFFYNLLLIPIAAGALYPLFEIVNYNPNKLNFIFGDSGFLNPVMAAFAMAFSSITVISNSLRLKAFKP